MRFHRKYQQFDEAILEPTRKLFDAGAWKGTREERLSKFQAWWDEVSENLGYQKVLLVHVAEVSDLFRIPPEVDPEDVMKLGSLTVLELFHSFRHEMHLREDVPPSHEACNDAHAWACSLYFVSRPETFAKSVVKGLIPGVSELDMVEPDDRGCVLNPLQQATFESIADDLIEDLSADPEMRALLDQFGGAE